MKDFRQSRIKRNLLLRAEMTHAVRRYFMQNGYVEVETPVRIPAPAPEAHIDAIPSGSMFLQTSPELYMKRLLAAGFDRLFQICKCFRENERGGRHLPEFTLLEWYRTHWDYRDMMDDCENLLRHVAKSIGIGNRLEYQGTTVNLDGPWQRMTVESAFAAFADIPLTEALAQERFDEIMALSIEPRLGAAAPVFLHDYPAEKGSFARLSPEEPAVAERFELYICGLEMCNAFTELRDPETQRRRFTCEAAVRKKSGKRDYPMPDAFLAALQDMPPAAGNALGIDRLAMLFCDAPSIDAVTAFVPEDR